MNTVIFSIRRRNMILHSLSIFRFLYTSHIRLLHFQSKAGHRKCKDVMLQMFKQGQVRRFREHCRAEYLYHVEHKTQAWKSVILLNNLYFDIAKRGKVLYFQPELVFFSGRCDGFFVIEHRGKRKKFFCEIDRGTNAFKKSAVYAPLLQSTWQGEAWADPLKTGTISFPLIVVLTLRPHIVEKDFAKAEFRHKILDLYEPDWLKIFT